VKRAIGRNYKRFENEQVRDTTITRDNHRLLGKMNEIQRQEHYPRAIPRRPYTLMGQAQKEEMWRITHENRKLLTAVQERRPVLNRNDWQHHKLDHTYQITKTSEYTKTVPMGEIIGDGLIPTSQGSRLVTSPEARRASDHAGGQNQQEAAVSEVIGDTVKEGSGLNDSGGAGTKGASSGAQDGQVRDIIKDGVMGNATKDDPASDPGTLSDPIKGAVTSGKTSPAKQKPAKSPAKK
jgi:hypothetical protein